MNSKALYCSGNQIKSYKTEHKTELRLKKYELERNNEDIMKVENKVLKIRNYIKELGYEQK